MAALHKMYHSSELASKLLSASRTLRGHTSSDLRICAPASSKCLQLLSIRQYFTPGQAFHSFLPSTHYSKTLQTKNYGGSRCLPQLQTCINARYISSMPTLNYPASTRPNVSKSRTKRKPSSPSNKSMVIQKDEIMFFDKFLDLDKVNEASRRVEKQIPLQKNFFIPTTQFSERTAEEVQGYLARHQILLNRADVQPPIQQFLDVEFPEEILQMLQKDYAVPTPVQSMGWSLALCGRDMIGVGQTGSGKTLAYVVPGLIHTAHQQRILSQTDPNFSHRTPVAIVLAPSRELATQISRVAEQYGPALGVEVLLLTGGVFWRQHVTHMQNFKPKFIIATPGRLLDLMRSKRLLLDYCTFLVLDEADRMLDLGFEPQMRAIVQRARSDRQTQLWSATWPEQVQDLASSFLQANAVRLRVGTTELRANPDIDQHVHHCEFLEKTGKLKQILREVLQQDPANKALVFVKSRRDSCKLYHTLRSSGFSCESLHGGLDQPLRNRVVADFRKGRFTTLLATDVAARGLDIQGLSCVINYDFPDLMETYVHRIGRTGRCGQRGVAHTFFSQRHIGKAFEFAKILRESGQKVDNRLLYMAAKSRFLPESEKEIFHAFVPQKTAEGQKRSQSMMGGRNGKLLGPVPEGTLSPRQFAMHQSDLKHQARLQAKLSKRDKSKVVDTKYCVQKKRNF